MLRQPLWMAPARSMMAARSLPEHLIHVIDAELVVTGGNGCVRGEDALLLDAVEVGFGGSGDRAAAELAELVLEQADGEQGRVALVHVVHLGATTEGVKEVDAAEAEDRLLAEAIEGDRHRRGDR